MAMLTRRAVLAGGVGALTLAACDRSSGAVVQRSGTLRSRHMPGRDIRWRLAMPARHGDGVVVRPPVVVLHGMGGNADAAFEVLALGDHVERTGLTIASVDGGVGYWHPRRSGEDAGAMVVEDFLPVLGREHGSAERVSFLGWSMGGYGALLLASQLGPGRVVAVVAESAALWTAAGLSAPGAFDDKADFEEHDVFAARRIAVLATIPVRLDCGRDDPFVAANRSFAKALPSARLTVDTGGHTNDYWRSHAGAQLDWVAARSATA